MYVCFYCYHIFDDEKTVHVLLRGGFTEKGIVYQVVKCKRCVVW